MGYTLKFFEASSVEANQAKLKKNIRLLPLTVLFMICAVGLFAKTEISLPELIRESLPDMPGADGSLNQKEIVREPVHWLHNFWNLPELDGFFRYPVRSLSFYLPSPSRNGKLALRYSYTIKYNKFKLPEIIYKYRYRWGMRSRGVLVAQYRFRFFEQKQEMRIQDSRGRTIIKSILMFRKRKKEENPLRNYYLNTPFALPTKKYIPKGIREKLNKLSAYYIQREEFGKYGQLLWTELFFYPAASLQKKILLNQVSSPEKIAFLKTRQFWEELRKPFLSLSFMNINDYKILSKIQLFTWDYQKIVMPEKDQKAKGNSEISGRSGQDESPVNRAIQFIWKRITNFEDRLMFETIPSYENEYPLEITSLNSMGEREFTWSMQYHQTIPADLPFLRPYYQKVMEKKEATDTTREPSKSNELTSQLHDTKGFKPVDITPSNFWGLEQLLPAYFANHSGGFLNPWPLYSNLPKEALKRNDLQKVTLKIIFHYRDGR